jgi:2-keto-4-pentenoate hydratase/2-oxohepta-3-ene-1,7-dioic acid hydratase in catechol pathway
MKLVTYTSDDSTRTGAVRANGAIVDVSAVGDAIHIMFDSFARKQAQGILDDPNAVELQPGSLLSPITPRALICIGLNYMDHVRETGAKAPERPVVFAKFANALASPGETVTWYADATREVDYEAELGVVIGRKCYRVSKEEALHYVGGYTCVNDISARDIQNTDSARQFTLGKTPDGFCPIGPWLVTADEIADPQNLAIKCILNGQVVQDSNTKQMIFDVATLIAHLSKFMTLMPGDLIATGTPPGVGMSRKPPLWLKDGDMVTIEIEKIGSLTNTCHVM